MYRSKPRDEEEHLLTERGILLQHKQELELQQAKFGLAYRPSYLPIQIGDLEEALRRIDRRIAYVRRKKRLKATIQQVASVGEMVTGAVLSPTKPVRRLRRRGAAATSLPGMIGVVLIIGLLAAVTNARPGLSGEYVQTAAEPLRVQVLPEPTAAILPTIAPIQETAMAAGAWPPPDAERRVIGATGGIGVRLRVNPYSESHSFIDLPDGTLVYLIAKQPDHAGAVWWWVALADGTTGYVNEQHLHIP